MSMINGVRTVNALTAGTMNAAALQTYLGIGSNAGSLGQAMNLKGQGRLLANSASAITAIIGSPAALALLQQSQAMMSVIMSSPVALPAIKAVPAACRALGQSVISNPAFEPAFQWTARTLPVTATISNIAYNGTIYVAITTVAGVYWTSTDLVTWTQHTFPAPAKGVVYGQIYYANNQFMVIPTGALSTTSTLLTSPDGATWTAQQTGTTYTISRAAYGAGKWVLVTGQTNNITSPDGVTWTNVGFSPAGFNSIAFGAGLFVATANTASANVYSSPDGATWTARTVTSSVAWSVTWNGTIFLLWSTASNATQTSTSGTAWAAGLLVASVSGVSNVVYANGVFIAQINASATYYTSTNPVAGGNAWAAQTLPGAATAGSLSVANNTAFFCETTSAPNVTYSSTNGVAWAFVMAPTATLTAAASLRYGNGTWVISMAGSQAGFLVSTDAINWTVKPIPTGTVGSWLIDYHPAAALFMAVNTGSTTYYTSPDLLTWTARTAPIAPTAGGFTCGSGFAMLANATALYTSADAINWTLGVLPLAAATYAYSNGVFAAMPTAAATSVYVSTTGQAWTQLTGMTQAIYTGFSSNGSGTYVFTGGAQQISVNSGGTWATPSFGSAVICYANGLFVGIAASAIVTSVDAQNWNTRYAVNTSTYGGNQIVFSGGAYVGLAAAGAEVLTNFA